MISDLEGDTEATSTSDLASSKGPSRAMVRAAALQPWAALQVLPSRTVILKQIFPLAYTSVLAADILVQASPFPWSCQRSPAVWSGYIATGEMGGFSCNEQSWKRYPCTVPTVVLAQFPAGVNNRASGNVLYLHSV